MSLLWIVDYVMSLLWIFDFEMSLLWIVANMKWVPMKRVPMKKVPMKKVPMKKVTMKRVTMKAHYEKSYYEGPLWKKSLWYHRYPIYIYKNLYFLKRERERECFPIVVPKRYCVPTRSRFINERITLP